MKKIVKGNDFTMRIPVMKIVDGEKQAFPLPGCTDIVVRACSAYRRLELAYTVDAKEDNVLLARVEGDEIPLGTYALEVRGKIFGNDWRSNEYEQFAIVDKNADADTEFGETDEGDNSVEMDTAIVFLPPDRELSALVNQAQENVKTVTALNAQVTGSEEARTKSEESRAAAETARVQAELTRVSQETARVQAETTRTKAEEKREASHAKMETESEAMLNTAKAYLEEAEVVSVQAETIDMVPNKYYDITLAASNMLTLTLQATDDTTHAHDYEGGFDAGDDTAPTVTWPEGVQWADMPTLKYGRHYEFNIRVVAGKKYGVVYVWDK